MWLVEIRKACAYLAWLDLTKMLIKTKVSHRNCVHKTQKQNMQNFNPAEFALDLVSVDYSSPESEAESRARVEKLLAAHRYAMQATCVMATRHTSVFLSIRFPTPKLQTNAFTITTTPHTHQHSAKLPSLLASIKKRRASLLAVQTKAKAGTKDPSTTQVAIASKRGCGKIEQFRLLFKRSWRQITRSKAANIARAGRSISKRMGRDGVLCGRGVGACARTSGPVDLIHGLDSLYKHNTYTHTHI